MRVYLDYHSTTPCDPRVVKVMEPYHSINFGNPSALHVVGEKALDAVENARSLVANAIKASPENVHFCSGATEANNIVIKGFWLNRKRTHRRTDKIQIVTSPIEHGSIIRCVEYIKECDPNLELRLVGVNGDGTIDLNSLENILDYNKKSIVSIMTANNEIGTIYNIKEISRLCIKYGAFFHTDATQALGKMFMDVNQPKVDAMSISSHKIYGPKGVGALYVSDRMADFIDPLLDGGYQNTYTSGTHNVPGIVGMGEACKTCFEPGELTRIKRLRDRLLGELISKIDGISINGTMENRLPNNLNISIDNVPSEALIVGMENVIVSGGAACKSGNHKVSHVLEAIGAKNPGCAIRFGLGRWTTEQEITYAINHIVKIVKSIRT
jgi:cysteine desulfurase